MKTKHIAMLSIFAIALADIICDSKVKQVEAEKKVKEETEDELSRH